MFGRHNPDQVIPSDAHHTQILAASAFQVSVIIAVRIFNCSTMDVRLVSTDNWF